MKKTLYLCPDIFRIKREAFSEIPLLKSPNFKLLRDGQLNAHALIILRAWAVVYL